MIEDKLSDFAKSQIDNALSYNEGIRQGYIQAKSEWVGLTVDEIAELVCNLEDPENRIELGQKIEAKLKERNT